MTLHHRARWAGVLLVIAAGCGRKGPPLPPEHLSPEKPAKFTARRVDGRTELQFTLPAKNTNGTTPVALMRVDVFALSLAAGEKAPRYETLPTAKHLVGHIDVKPGDAAAPADEKAPVDPRPAPGDVATFSETPPAPGPPLASADADALPSRLYTVVGIGSDRRQGPMSEVILVPETAAPDAPVVAKPTYDHTTLTLTWTGVADGAFRVYAVDHTGKELPGGPLTASPVKALTFSMPVQFGVETCLVVRTVVTAGSVATESAPAAPEPRCTTPVDTFAPPVPTGLNAVPDVGVVQLAWNPVTWPDLAGYVVLRRVAGTATLQRLKAELVPGTTYEDSTARAGVTYEYAVRAVDQSTPPNESADSEHKTVTARLAPRARERALTSHKDF